MKSKTLLIVGGYGVVGEQLATLFAARNPGVHILIGGRTLARAQALADRLPSAAAVKIDVMEDDPLAALTEPVDGIVVAVNDHRDRLLAAAIARAIPLVDIARWTARIDDALAMAKDNCRSPVVLASGWMAGAVATVTAASVQGQIADQVDIDILFGMADKAGPDSVVGFVNMHQPFGIREHGQFRMVRSLTDGRTRRFPLGQSAKVRRFSTPDQQTLITSGIAKGAAMRMAFDSAAMMTAFTAMVRSGLWGLLPVGVREKLLHNPGNGDAHQVVISAMLPDRRVGIAMTDKLGQTHMTAAGAVSQAERLLGLRGRMVPRSGVSYPEMAQDVVLEPAALRDMGVEVTEWA
jgi:saccharopine dehydrogenase-like NADP-dependent oxidoreductase